ncbi:hypothetical protein B9Z65_6429 [Elsinoe australis]|uniref:Uncharacterized protein n=1 Tax=Elsinoe australis TaxID=40998 RepID=A0A2P8A8L6_9PEZI|nr:hypothetical protein B9Z65_6429 [Elsinoe australis]
MGCASSVPVPVQMEASIGNLEFCYMRTGLTFVDEGCGDISGLQYQRVLDEAPAVVPGFEGKTYPHRYNDGEGLFGTNTSLYEYPAHRYPYEHQKKNGKLKAIAQGAEKGYVRTVTVRNKNMRGVIYHPQWSRTEFERADEVGRPRTHLTGGSYLTKYQRQESSMPPEQTGQVKQRNIGTTTVIFDRSHRQRQS